MERNEPYSRFKKSVLKPMGLILVPLAFTAFIYGILVLLAGVSLADLNAYASVLLSDSGSADFEAAEFLDEGKLSVLRGDAVDASTVTFPTYGQAFGELTVDSVGIDCPVIWGDNDALLRQGACQSIYSKYIGDGGTSMISAHVNRHFKELHNVQVGDEIEVRTTYGIYTYTVTYVGAHIATDESVYDLQREDENLVLYTCYYEKTALGSVKKRFFVCADYVSGPMIVYGNQGGTK